MQELLRVPDFASSGLNTDLPSVSLPPSFLTDLSNVRISRGKLSPFGGSGTWGTLPVDFQPGYIQFVGEAAVKYWVICGADAVYAFDGSTFTAITSAVGYASISDEDLWTGCAIANIPVFNHPNHHPEYWSPQNIVTPLQPLPWDASNTWSAAGEAASIMRSHKQFLFAMDLQSGTYGEVPDGVRWSSPADIGGVPDTWDELDTTNFAGLTNLGGAGGKIIDGLTLRDSFCVYRESGITIFDYAGGQFVWSIRNLSNMFGLLSKNSVIEVNGDHYFIGDGDIIKNDGNDIRSIVHNRIRKRIRANFNASAFATTYAVRNSYNSEIWFCAPEGDADYPNIAYIWNWRDDSWTIRDIPEGAIGNSGSLTTPVTSWSDMSNTWETYSTGWKQSQAGPLDDSIVIAVKPTGVGLSGSLQLPDVPLSDIDGTYATSIERTGLTIAGVDGKTMITRVYPHIVGSGCVTIEVGSQDTTSSPIRWKPAVLFTPGVDRKIDVRSTGSLHCIRITCDDVTGEWELSGIDIEYLKVGER